MCGWGAGGGTGFVGVVGNNGGTVMTAEKGRTSPKDCDGEMEGEDDAEIWGRLEGSVKVAVDRGGDAELERAF